ncbi:uncharacterized protein [Thunnus thynnus]|uniref:uncharacterized protein isoform X2 n=1 Tax=Thunnus thynnus TaxID=8237 RepID=UPI003528AE97
MVAEGLILILQIVRIQTNIYGVHDCFRSAFFVSQDEDQLDRPADHTGVNQGHETICCDVCQRWYHHECVQRSPVDEQHLCPACKSFDEYQRVLMMNTNEGPSLSTGPTRWREMNLIQVRARQLWHVQSCPNISSIPEDLGFDSLNRRCRSLSRFIHFKKHIEDKDLNSLELKRSTKTLTQTIHREAKAEVIGSSLTETNKPRAIDTAEGRDVKFQETSTDLQNVTGIRRPGNESCSPRVKDTKHEKVPTTGNKVTGVQWQPTFPCGHYQHSCIYSCCQLCCHFRFHFIGRPV